MRLPRWYGVTYPSTDDLAMYAESLGAAVIPAPLSGGAYAPAMDGRPPIVFVPARCGPLRLAWELAHEIGHLCQHSGAKGKPYWSKDEAQASRWAACALIPQARIDRHLNASADAFMAALSAHYEELPLCDCPERSLAHEIATIRIRVLEVV